MHKLKNKGNLEKKGLKVKIGQLFLRSKVGSKIFDYANIIPFGETEVLLDKFDDIDDDFINANYIKTAYQESHP